MEIRIALCDDEQYSLSALKEIVLHFFRTKSVECSIKLFQSGDEFLKSQMQFDMVFLDIDMHGISGIEAGRILKSLNKNCKIVMATGRTEFFKEAFKINAFRFVTKPFEEEEIYEALCGLMRIKEYDGKQIELFDNRNRVMVHYRDIKYIAAYGSYCEFAVHNEMMRKEVSLLELEKELDESFFRVHRQYILNLNYIDRYEDGYVMIERKKIPVARRRKKMFEQAWIEWKME